MDETIRYRLKRGQLPWWIPLFPVLNVVLASPAPAHMAKRLAFAAVGVALAFAVLAWQSTTGVDLRPDALVMRGVRRRQIPWRDISWIEVSPMLGTRTVGIRVGERVMRLRAPVHTRFIGSDPDFDAKARTIFAYWARYRGPDWQPTPPWAWWASRDADRSGT